LKLLASPGFAAGCGVLLAASIHPALPDPLRPPLVMTAALALLLMLGLLLGGEGRPDRLVGLGALAVVAALAYDGLRGHRGTLTVEVGQGTRTFEEEGPDGRSLGLRPLGFDVILEQFDPAGAAVLRAVDGATISVRPRRAAWYGGVRLGAPASFGGAYPSRLHVAVAGPEGTTVVEVAPGLTATAHGLRISLERYFPDFALDEKQQPYSRSSEPRNPAALLQVARGSQTWRIFVIRAMPGIHRPEGLDDVLTLTEVVPSDVARLRVNREPAAAFALLGAMLMAGGLAWRSRTP